MDKKQYIRKILNETIQENVVTTHIDEAVRILNNMFKDNLKAERNSEQDTEIDVFITKQNNDVLNKLLPIIEGLGYFISKFGINNMQFIYNDIEFANKVNSAEGFPPIYLKLEAEHERAINDVPPKLYHVTHDRHLEKIKKIGLVPTSKSKKSYHPERIYFVDDIESANIIAKEFSDMDVVYKSGYIALEIDTNKTSGAKIYRDPNFKSHGYFTQDNIPPLAIDFDNIIKIELP